VTAANRPPTSGPAAEEPVMLAEVFITRRSDGEYIARLSIDEQAGWVVHGAENAEDALEGAVLAARESLRARLRRRSHLAPTPNPR
jgi:hypothetical protein